MYKRFSLNLCPSQMFNFSFGSWVKRFRPHCFIGIQSLPCTCQTGSKQRTWMTETLINCTSMRTAPIEDAGVKWPSLSLLWLLGLRWNTRAASGSFIIVSEMRAGCNHGWELEARLCILSLLYVCPTVSRCKCVFELNYAICMHISRAPQPYQSSMLHPELILHSVALSLYLYKYKLQRVLIIKVVITLKQPCLN